MSVWEKIKQGLGVGVETVSEKTEELSNLAKLNWEKFRLQKSFEKELNLLGGKVFQLHIDNREKELSKETTENVKKLKELEEQLQAKVAQIEEMSAKGEIDKKHLKEFKKDLELGDGTIEQFVIAENSKIVGKKLMEIKLPDNVLVGAIVREEKVIIPDGNTVIQTGDKVTLLGEKDEVEEAAEIMK
jgi:K+/H+ antiporter YhaU regulatory subunit KhtT